MTLFADKTKDMTTQKMIIEVIKTNKLLTPNASDSFKIINTFNSLDRSKNYSWMFKKTQECWTAQDWRAVARDVQEMI